MTSVRFSWGGREPVLDPRLALTLAPAARRQVTSARERVYVHYSAHHPGVIAGWRSAYVALQHGLGILSQRRAGISSCYCAGTGSNGSSVMEEFTAARGASNRNRPRPLSRRSRLGFQLRRERGPDFCRFSGLDSTEAERRQASHGPCSPGG